MRDHTDPAHLKARLHEVGAQFLLTEVQTGLALLDIANTSISHDANERRRALAVEAYDVVADRLARNPNVVPLTDDERAVISKLHQELGKRLGR